MSIVLNNLVLENFKGVRNLSIQFGKETVIYGTNGAGKTTIVDAFTWLLWGKDSTGRASFDIRPLDKNNFPIHIIDCSVTGVLEKNGIPVRLKKIYREKWQKKKGSPEEELNGNEVIYEINDVPVKQKEFKDKIDSLIDESVFKVLTSPVYFNSMPWQERRNILLTLVGNITDEEIAGENPEYRDLLTKIASEGATLADYQKSIASRRAKIKVELDAIPTRVDEVSKSLPEELNFSELEDLVSKNKNRIEEIDNLIASDAKKTIASNQAKNEKILAIQDEIFQAKSKTKEIEEAHKTAETDERNKKNALVKQITEELATCRDLIQNNTGEIVKNREQIEQKTKEKNELVAQWCAINAEKFEFNPDECLCPTCKRKLEPDDIEKKGQEMLSNFNLDKQKRLNVLELPGNTLKSDIEKLEKSIPELEAEIENFRKKLPELEEQLKKAQSDTLEIKHFLTRTREDEEYKKLSKSVTDKETEIETLKSSLEKSSDLSEIRQEKTDLEKANSALAEKLATRLQRENGLKRIEELKADQKTKAQAISDFEKIEYTAFSFLRDKMNTLEYKVNQMFSGVKFKMFNTLLNGGEEPCCICLIDGVPFSGANTAGQINAGIECINVISKFYNETAPIFIDGRESVINLIPTESQVISLVVSESDNQLRIENK